MKTRQRKEKRPVFVITGGQTLAGNSNRARKSYSRNTGHEVLATEVPKKIQKSRPVPIMFTEEDAKGVSYPHDDALIIKANLGGTEVERMLVDPGSAVDIISKEALDSLGVEFVTLVEEVSPLFGFGGSTIVPLGRVQLTMTLGTEPHTRIMMLDFVVVDCLSSYQAILGRPFMMKSRAAMSSYYLKLKFPTREGVGTVCGSQRVARNCFATASKEALCIEEASGQKRKGRGEECSVGGGADPRPQEPIPFGEPGEELESVDLNG